ncbi:putative tail protein [Aeromonas phage Ahp2]|nr:putative tail protein [Aeromonas phage Ahp2]
MMKVILPTPIKRTPGPEGEDRDVKEVMLREPKGGDLRGFETVAILRMDYTAHRTLIPRICPQLTANDIDQMDPKTLLAVQQEVVGFFVD